jgi:hypothetical protein
VVRNPDQDVEELVGQAAKIGYDRFLGELAGGMAAWGLSAAETGSVIGVRPEAVRLLQFRALALLRRMLCVAGPERPTPASRPADRPRRPPPGRG